MIGYFLKKLSLLWTQKGPKGVMTERNGKAYPKVKYIALKIVADLCKKFNSKVDLEKIRW